MEKKASIAHSHMLSTYIVSLFVSNTFRFGFNEKPLKRKKIRSIAAEQMQSIESPENPRNLTQGNKCHCADLCCAPTTWSMVISLCLVPFRIVETARMPCVCKQSARMKCVYELLNEIELNRLRAWSFCEARDDWTSLPAIQMWLRSAHVFTLSKLKANQHEKERPKDNNNNNEREIKTAHKILPLIADGFML